MTKRLPDWERRLQAAVDQFDGVPFVWGRSDCAHFAGACVEAVTGSDPLRRYRGRYNSRLGAAARMLYQNHRTVADAAAAELTAAGALEIDARAARVGDVGVTADDVLAVRLPSGFVARSAAGELYTTPVVKAWNIG